MPTIKSPLASTVDGLVGAFSSVGDQRFEQRETKTIPAGDYAHLEVKNANGNITVEGTEGEEIVLVATKKVKAKSEEEGQRGLSQIRIVLLEEKPNLKIATDVSELSPKRNWSVNYEVRLPMHMSLFARTSNGKVSVADLREQAQVETSNGNVTAHRIKSPITARTSNGNVKLHDVEGAIEARTTNGNVYGQLRTLDKEKPTTLHSTNGNVQLAMPEDVSAKVVAATRNGNVHCDLPISLSQQRRNHLEGAIGSGEGEIELRTTNGNVSITGFMAQ
ncbi:MAG: DUF4097 family beta strand repeat protein [Candidatus Latescibacteria bacterium]|nr:DUF4097 family beta strand repeat protein [Candidatus Latescibacterota bacterium]